MEKRDASCGEVFQVKSVCFGNRRREMFHLELERRGVCFSPVRALVIEMEKDVSFGEQRGVRAMRYVLW